MTMTTLTSSVLDSTPNFVDGTFGAKDVRLAALGNALPGLFAADDFAASQRAAGANMSLDIAQGCAFVDPRQATHQGVYLVRRTSATPWNTSADGGITWTPADGSNPRIDLVLLEVKDNAEDASGTTGFRIRIETGTANASATHQLEVAYWPSIPAGCVPIAAVLVPAAATTLTTANITNLNPIGGTGRAATKYTAAVETITASSYARPATPDFLMVYVPNVAALVRLSMLGHMKVNVASGTQYMALFINGIQLKSDLLTDGAPQDEFTLANPAQTIWGRYVTDGGEGNSIAQGTGSDVSDVSTGMTVGQSGSIEIHALTAGWHVIEARFKTTANTVSIRERYMRAQVIG